MPRKCSVCTNPHKDEIDEAIIAGEPIRDIARQFDINKSAISRHKQKHLPSTIVNAKKGEDIVKATNLVEEISRLKSKAENIAKKAEEKGDYRTALAGVRELTRIVELLAKMQGEIKDQAVNIVFNAEWIELRAVILSTLDEYPEVKAKVVEALSHADQ